MLKKKKVKLVVFANVIIFYTKVLNTPPKKLIELKNQFRKGTNYKITYKNQYLYGIMNPQK